MRQRGVSESEGEGGGGRRGADLKSTVVRVADGSARACVKMELEMEMVTGWGGRRERLSEEHNNSRGEQHVVQRAVRDEEVDRAAPVVVSRLRVVACGVLFHVRYEGFERDERVATERVHGLPPD